MMSGAVTPELIVEPAVANWIASRCARGDALADLLEDFSCTKQ